MTIGDDAELDETPFDRYLRLKYEGEDPRQIYQCLENLEEIFTLRGAAESSGLSLESVVKWAHTFLASQVLRDIDHSDPFWRALLQLAADFPEEFEENWELEEERQPQIEKDHAMSLALTGTPFLRGRKRSIPPSVEEALTNEAAEQAEVEKANRSTLWQYQPTSVEVRDLRYHAIHTVESAALKKLLVKFTEAGKTAPSDGVVVEQVVAAAQENSFRVPHSPSPHAPCPLCRGVASDPRSKGYSLPAGLIMHLNGERQARECLVMQAARGLEREQRAFRDSIDELIAKAEMSEGSPGGKKAAS